MLNFRLNFVDFCHPAVESFPIFGFIPFSISFLPLFLDYLRYIIFSHSFPWLRMTTQQQLFGKLSEIPNPYEALGVARTATVDESK